MNRIELLSSCKQSASNKRQSKLKRMQAHSHRPSSAINSTDQVAGAVLTSSRPASTNVTSSSSGSADQSESSQTDQDLLTADIETASISSSAEMSQVPDSSNSTAMWSQGAQAAAAQPLPLPQKIPLQLCLGMKKGQLKTARPQNLRSLAACPLAVCLWGSPQLDTWCFT